MSDIIDLQQRRDERDCEICWEHPVTGERWYQYTLSYELDGREFSFSAWARSDEDAARRLAEAIRATLRLDGRVYAERSNV